MPARTLPTFSRAEVAAHNSKKSLYVTVGRNVYDLSDFAGDHPGGVDLVLEYAGRDVEEILRDEASHAHSEAAYEVLEDSLVGFFDDKTATSTHGNGKVNGTVNANGNANGNAKPNGNGNAAGADGLTMDQNGACVHPRTGMSCEEDLSRETDYDNDYKRHKFIDLNKPMFSQVWFGGFTKEFYLDQVHRPRHYRGGKSAPFFGNFLEPLTKTPWWVVPLVWVPPISYGTWIAAQCLSLVELSAYWAFGFLFWTLIEYILHRFLFHLDEWLPDNRVGLSLHFMMHGVHHYLPMDKYRLVMPPALLTILMVPFWPLAHAIIFWDESAALAAFCGGLFGYVCYDLTHYFLHHQNLPLWYKELKRYHLQHHFLDYELGFGVTSKFWDRVFGTELPQTPKVVKTL